MDELRAGTNVPARTRFTTRPAIALAFRSADKRLFDLLYPGIVVEEDA